MADAWVAFDDLQSWIDAGEVAARTGRSIPNGDAARLTETRGAGWCVERSAAGAPGVAQRARTAHAADPLTAMTGTTSLVFPLDHI
jgi:hypothetical protein